MFSGNFSWSSDNCIIEGQSEYGESGNKWIEARKAFFDEISSNGLSVGACDRFYNSWVGEEVLSYAKTSEFILQGGEDEKLNNFVRFDTFLGGEGITMLPFHQE